MKNRIQYLTSFAVLGAALLLVGGCTGGDDEPEPECGNGIREGLELCDTDDTVDISCEDLNVGQGIVTCTSDCLLDLSMCSEPPECGNGIREGMEECDASALSGAACDDLGYDGGELSCDTSCAFDTGMCCEHSCPGAGDTQCFGDVIRSCTTQPSGCLAWQDALDCGANLPPQVCDASGGEASCVLPCTDQCTTAGHERCQWDAVIQTCELQPGGCLDWSLTDDCSIHDPVEVCDASGNAASCIPACTDSCTTQNEFRCAGDALEKCDLVYGGCLEWTNIHDCTLNPCGSCYDWGGGYAECTYGC
ncbi:MAG: hypothetical protein ABI333_29720 [bacterium]